MKRLFALLLLSVLALNSVNALTYSLVDARDLPVFNINDPLDHKNHRITRYSYEELEYFITHSANFLRWNDGKKVCESMVLMFGKKPAKCFSLPPPKRFVREEHTYVLPRQTKRSTSVGHVSFTIGPTVDPVKYHYGRPILHVQHAYPRSGHIWYPWG